MAPKKDAVAKLSPKKGAKASGKAKESKSPPAKAKINKTANKKASGSHKEEKKASPKKAKATKEEKPEAANKGSDKKTEKAESSGKRKKEDAKDEKPAKKAKGGSKDAPKHAKEQLENPVEAITDPREVPKGVKRDSRGRLTFDGFPKFKPTLTPKQVIQAGSFGGIYFNPLGGKKGVKYPNGPDISADEFPKDWFEGLNDEQYKGKRYNVELNKYGVKSGQNQQQWEEQGWIKDQDQRGWFQWYCRFTQGRRTDDDERQISRWVGVAGPKGRWKTRLVNLVKDKGGVDHVQDASISPVIRQNLLHWAYELTPQDFEAME